MLLYLKIKPNQRFDGIEKVGNEWQIRIKAPAVDGKANEHLVSFLSDVFGISKSKIRHKKGFTSRMKCLEIDADDVFIQECLAKASGTLHNSV
jgi:uncharacterized protein (TIGR00251 family)